jgi:hypothetical protein
MSEYHNEQFDVVTQQAARGDVMEMPLFPDLDRELIKALGFGPHCKMLQHFVYWFHPRHPKMQQRWTLYKTLDEWHDECGLTERQVRKGRKVLVDRGLITYKRGQYSRVHYRVNWVALANVLWLDYEPDIPFDFEDDFMSDGITVENETLNHEFMSDGITVESKSDGITVESKSDGITVDLNAGDYAGDYLQETTLLQRAAEPAFAEPAAKNRTPKEEEITPKERLIKLYGAVYDREESA